MAESRARGRAATRRSRLLVSRMHVLGADCTTQSDINRTDAGLALATDGVADRDQGVPPALVVDGSHPVDLRRVRWRLDPLLESRQRLGPQHGKLFRFRLA
jgi:hypothetical protein